MTTMAASVTATAAAKSCHSSCRSSTCPPWLQAAIVDIEQRVKSVAGQFPDAGSGSVEPDSFAERAENYYQKRPQLIQLLHDLHHRYLYLADRYSQSLHRRRPSGTASDLSDDVEPPDSLSDTESSLSFQFPPPIRHPLSGDLDLILAELVSSSVERHLVAIEAEEAAKLLEESSRKIDLQGSLVEVLESERMVLLGENARLGFRAAAAEEERRAAAAELGYMRRRAAELARAVVKLREDHRVCMLGRRIEGLQAQIYALERRNRECFDAMAVREKAEMVASEEVERLRFENRRLKVEVGRRGDWWGRKWWGRVRSVEWVPMPCGSYVKEEVKGGKGCF